MSRYAYDSRDLVVMALTMWGEARNEGNAGLAAVGWCIRNRAEADLWGDGKPDWWGEGIAGVCLPPWQFSCWNANDPGSAQMRAMLTGGSTDTASLNARGLADAKLQQCMAIARDVLDGKIEDPTKGATHYYADYIATPGWAKGKDPGVTIGRHRFFADVEPGYTPAKQALGANAKAPKPPVYAGLPPNQPAPETPPPAVGRGALKAQALRMRSELDELVRMIDAETV